MNTLEVARRPEAGNPAPAKAMAHAYGFDEVAIVPGAYTVNPELTDVSFSIGEHTFAVPVLAAALDAVVDPSFAGKIGRFGGLAVLNLEGIHTRYEDPAPLLVEFAAADKTKVTELLQHAYTQPIQLDLIGERVSQMKAEGVKVAVSCTPANAKKFAPAAVEAGCDIFFVQSTVTTARHVSRSLEGLRFERLTQDFDVPIVVGNTVGYAATKPSPSRTSTAPRPHRRRAHAWMQSLSLPTRNTAVASRSSPSVGPWVARTRVPVVEGQRRRSSSLRRVRRRGDSPLGVEHGIGCGTRVPPRRGG